MFTEARHRVLFGATWIRTSPSHPISYMIYLISKVTLYAQVIGPMRATQPTQFTLHWYGKVHPRTSHGSPEAE